MSLSDWLNDPKFEFEQLVERDRLRRGAKICAALDQHDWEVDGRDFWLVVTLCRRCGVSKDGSLGINDFGKHIQSLPEAERQDAIDERKGPWKAKVLGKL